MKLPPCEPLAWKDLPTLLDRVLPSQKLSHEAHKERMSAAGQTLTSLGSYWKGRKPLILNKACVLGCLLPATDDPFRDLEIFEMLMGMDRASLAARVKRRPTAKEVFLNVPLANPRDWFAFEPDVLPGPGMLDRKDPAVRSLKVRWRSDVGLADRRRQEAKLLPDQPYGKLIWDLYRPEEVPDVHHHIWDEVNDHFGTSARSFPELVEQAGVARFGHRPMFADPFCGSGQIPYEAARLGCDVYAADLNPIACLLTWGAFHVVGAPPEERARVEEEHRRLAEEVRNQLLSLGFETDSRGRQAKTFLYCVEARCPQTGWAVPLLPSRVISQKDGVVAELVPDPERRRYRVAVRYGATPKQLEEAKRTGTVRKEGRGGDPYLYHEVGGEPYRTRIADLRGDYRGPKRETLNRLRPWERDDVAPRPDDLLQERLYCVEWLEQGPDGRTRTVFEEVRDEDLEREEALRRHVEEHLEEWRARGWLPDMRIQPGAETARLLRERGWTHWHHLFCPRQLLTAALVRKRCTASTACAFANLLNWNSRLARWHPGCNNVNGMYDNQALNTLYNFGCRALPRVESLLEAPRQRPADAVGGACRVVSRPVAETDQPADLVVTDPPYGDAVHYEEIYDYFIAWLKDSPPAGLPEDWVWDSRRPLAITGEDDRFRLAMVEGMERVASLLSEGGRVVIQFTHQSAGVWSQLANIVWASGLQVESAWYVATEADNALQAGGSYVQGTVLLTCRKRTQDLEGLSNLLEYELEEEVRRQVETLAGVNEQALKRPGGHSVFEDPDLQLAGYAAALSVLTRYRTIDGRDMVAEARRPAVAGRASLVDQMIEFAVSLANNLLVPRGLPAEVWRDASPAERLYLKLVDLESRRLNTLDTAQNMAKAFRVEDYRQQLASAKSNDTRVRLPSSLGKLVARPDAPAPAAKGRKSSAKGPTGHPATLADTDLGAVLLALAEVLKDTNGDLVLEHLMQNASPYPRRKPRLLAIAEYLDTTYRPIDVACANAANVLVGLLRNQRL